MKFVRLLIGFLVLLLPTAVVSTEPSSLAWPDAVAEVKKWQTIATDCIASLKQYGTEEEKAAWRNDYAKAKAESDGMIAGLLVALSQGDTPGGLSDLQARVERTTSELGVFCNKTERLGPSHKWDKGVLDILNAFTKPAIDKLSAAVAALFEYSQKEQERRREVIRTQLEAAKWPDFG